MQKIAILYDASQIVLSTFDLDEVLQQILSIVRDYFNLEHGCILLIDPQKQDLYIRSQFGRVESDAQIRIPLGTGITGTAAKLKRPVYVPDVTKDPRYVMSVKSTRSELAVPLMVRDEVVGILDCQSEHADYFDNDVIDLLTLFSTQASIALQNAQLYSLEQRRSRQLEALNAIARDTSTELDLAKLLPKLCDRIRNAFPVDHVAVLLLENEQLALRAHGGKLTPRVHVGDLIPMGSGLCGRALTQKKTVMENNVADVAGYIHGFEETVSEMCLPLISAGDPVGVLTLESSRPGAFQPEDLQPLESVADICATAIKNAEHVQRISQMAYIDGLTSIFNRRHFESKILDEIERSMRYPTRWSVVMIDIDHFKRINDEFGHLLGDEVLRQVAQIFGQHIRKPDILCRYGGEEFAILLPQTYGEGAVGMADKLRKLVEEWHFPGVPRRVTISAGVAEFPGHGKTRDDLVQAADDALYQAKQTGRNRVAAAGGSRMDAAAGTRS